MNNPILDDFVLQISCSIDENDIQNKINLFIQNNKSYVLSLSLILDFIDDKYYNEGTSPWTDSIYDLFIESIYKTVPELQYKIKKKVGYTSNSKDNEVLPFYMGSMNKIKTENELNNWTSKFSSNFVISAKLDGISALYYKNKLYTRGNGTIGRDISFLLNYIKFPKNFNFCLRGELIITKKKFEEKYKHKYANARNLVCGIINHNFSEDYISYYTDIDFVVYDIYNVKYEFWNKMKMLEEYKNDINIVAYNKMILHNIDISLCNNILSHWKKNYKYEIDGIIIMHNEIHTYLNDQNPKFAIAYKNNDLCVMMSEGIVEKIIWNISKDNYIKPKIKLINPVICDSSKISYVTGFNAKYILENGIMPGTKLLIGLSGNVIPHIFKVISKLPAYTPDVFELDSDYVKLILNNIPDLQTNFYWSKNNVDLISKDTNNIDVHIKKNMMLFKSFDVKCSLQETTLINVYNSIKLYKLFDILNMDVSLWTQVDKVGNKKALSIIQGIKNKLDINLIIKDKDKIHQINSFYEYFIKILVGSQCLERGFSNKKIELYLNYIYDLSLSLNHHFTIEKFYNNTYIDTYTSFIINNFHNFPRKLITKDTLLLFLKGIVKFNTFLNELIDSVYHINIPSSKTLFNQFILYRKQNNISNNDTTTNNLKIVFTGFRDKELEQFCISKGHEIMNSITKNINYLVVKDLDSQSSKIIKAKQYNIPIVLPEELLKKI